MEPLIINQKLTAYILNAQEEERKRISEELHDGVAQTIYSLYTSLEFIQQMMEKTELYQYVGQTMQLAERTLEELRWQRLSCTPLHLTALGSLPL